MRASYCVDRWINSHDPSGSNRRTIQPDPSANCSYIGHHATGWYSTGITPSSPTSRPARNVPGTATSS